MAKNSIVIICKNIKIDKNYQNCLTYSENEMYQLCYTNKVNMSNTFSFIRENENTLRVPFTYQECLSSNYMAFQNPRYSNKWFFAFIDSVEYVSDGATNINFTVDEFSTWWSYWSPVETFVIREHTNDDTVGSNVIDEGLGLGDFTCNYVNTGLQPFTTFKPVVGVSKIVTSPTAGGTETIPDFTEDGSIFNGIAYIVGDGDATATSHIVRAYDEVGESGDIQFIFMAPTLLLDRFTKTGWEISGFSDFTLRYLFLKKALSPYQRTFDFYKPTTLGNYTPVNKKLLTYPYSYLLVDPHDGNSYTYNYEDFIGATYTFRVDAVLTPGCSIKYTPQRYKGTLASGYNYAFSGAKLPMCSWNSDAYTNWLTQNGVNLGFTTLNQQEAMGLGGLASIAIGGALMATGVGGMMGAGLIMGGATGIFSSMQSDYRASMLPNQVKGNENTGDINYTLGLMNPTCYEMSIEEDRARSIDEYFTRFGYKTNRLKQPNQTGRKYFNYVEIGKSEIIGYPKTTAGVPADSMEKINNIYRSGVTLWHDHERIGNYAGNIITNPTPPPTPPPSPETTVIDTNIVVNDVNINKTNYINLLGNTTQDGTPAPDDPKEIKVVTDNILVQISNLDNSLQAIHPVNLKDIELCKIGDYQDGIYKSTGINLLNRDLLVPGSCNYGATGQVPVYDGTSSNRFTIKPENAIEVEPNTTYTFNMSYNNDFALAQMTAEKVSLGDTGWKTSSNLPFTITTSATTKYISFNFKKDSATNINVIRGYNFQLQNGTFTQYEPYGVVWYIHKEIKKLVLDENEDISSNASFLSVGRFKLNSYTDGIIGSQSNAGAISNYFKGAYAVENGNVYLGNDGMLNLINTTYTNDLAGFKTWLGTNKPIVYYILANPTYTIITDTELTTQLDQLYTAGLFLGTTRIVSYTNGANPYIKLHYNIS